MSKRERLEKIILGTLLDVSGQKYHDECMMLSQDMFCDGSNSRIYGYISELLGKDKPTDVNSVFVEYGEKVIDLVPYMVELSMNYAFDIIKVRKNELIWRANLVYGTDFNYHLETFKDYLDIFIKLVYKDEERKRDYAVSGAVASASR